MKPFDDPSRTDGESRESSAGPVPSDEELMERFLRGEESAFDALFDRYARPLQRYLARACGSPGAAEDLVQTTFVSVVRSRDRFQKGGRVRPWLYAIATNAARDWRRRSRSETLTETGELPEEAVPGAAERIDPALERKVRGALEALPERQREAILLHRYEGLSFSEIAESLGEKEVAVRVRAHRGYERLRELLAHLKDAL